jgi:hypothetical protein
MIRRLYPTKLQQKQRLVEEDKIFKSANQFIYVINLSFTMAKIKQQRGEDATKCHSCRSFGLVGTHRMSDATAS